MATESSTPGDVRPRVDGRIAGAVTAGALLALAAGGVSALLSPIAPTAALGPLYVAVIAAACLRGLAAGATAAILGLGSAVWVLSPLSSADLVGVVTYGASAGFVTALIASHRKQRDAARRDAAEAKRDQEHLRELAALAEVAPDAVLLVSPEDNRLVWCNGAAERLLRLSRDQDLGKDVVGLLVPEEHRAEALARVGLLARDEPVAPHEVWMARTDGTRVWCGVSAAPLRRPGGAVDYVAVVRDLTERRRMEEELRRKTIALAEQARQLEIRVRVRTGELESFCYSVSHDLRGPLRAMSGWASILRDDYGAHLPEEGRACAERIVAASRRMGELIDDLLHLTGIARAEPTPEPVDLVPLAREVAAELSLNGSPPTLALPPRLEVLADRALLRLALRHLLHNAAKAGARRIEIGEGVHDGVRALYVRDDGVGFDMAHQDRLFRPFERLHAPTEFPWGSGIGLSTVKRIIERHGGAVWADAAPGRGATFWFTLSSPRGEGARPPG